MAETKLKHVIVPLAERVPHAIYCDDLEFAAVQASKDECDINRIIARALSGHDILHVTERVAMYGDFSDVPSYMEALQLVDRAEGMFMSMSPEVRERFANDPARMVAFLQDPANRDEAVKLGLVLPKAPEPQAPGDSASKAPLGAAVEAPKAP